jgi:hypothetical protein
MAPVISKLSSVAYIFIIASKKMEMRAYVNKINRYISVITSRCHQCGLVGSISRQPCNHQRRGGRKL